METVTKVLYEAMFLVDSAEAASDWEGINQVITGILEKFGAEILSARKWDECKLAYEVNGKSRGTYILCYFRVEGSKIQGIERDVQLSERIMRVLILNAEYMTNEDIEKATPATLAQKRAEEASLAAAEAAVAAEEAAKVAAAEAAAAEAAVAAEEKEKVVPEIKEDLDVEESVVVDAIESETPVTKSESAEGSDVEPEEQVEQVEQEEQKEQE